MPPESILDLSLTEFVEQLANARVVDLRGYKHTTLARRLHKRMSDLRLDTYQEYLGRILADPEETACLLESVLINVTEFFRDPGAWDVIANQALPHLLRHRRTGESFRVWVAGCATGEEVYTLLILIAEYLGDQLHDFDLKVYATDIDEAALDTARRGEYPAGRLRRVPAEYKARYFKAGPKGFRINRDIRRMIVFGKSDLRRDAPISHVNLLICRNVLIYFDPVAQQQLLARFHYALEEGGILFLGKAETRLTESLQFEPIHSRWRIFRKVGDGAREFRFTDPEMDENTPQNKRLHLLQVYQTAILDTLGTGVMVLDEADTIIMDNGAMLNLWGMNPTKLSGRRVSETRFAERCEELVPKLAEMKASNQTIRFVCEVRQDGNSRMVEMTLRPVESGGQRQGALIYAEDVTHHERLQKTVAQLEVTAEELQSANEELETTNEELQSTNEELETTNEELQSTNEELETTNEELKSLNEELENINEELDSRGRELDALNAHYAETIEQMPWPMLTIDRDTGVRFWNSAAARMFNLPGRIVAGLSLAQLPILPQLREALSKQAKVALESGKAMTIRQHAAQSQEFGDRMDITITPLSHNGAQRGAIIMFGTAEGPLARMSTTGAKRPERNGGSRKKAPNASRRKKKKTAGRKR